MIHPVVLEQGQGEAVTFILVYITIAIQPLEVTEMLYFFLFECVILAIYVLYLANQLIFVILTRFHDAMRSYRLFM